MAVLCIIEWWCLKWLVCLSLVIYGVSNLFVQLIYAGVSHFNSFSVKNNKKCWDAMGCDWKCVGMQWVNDSFTLFDGHICIYGSYFNIIIPTCSFPFSQWRELLLKRILADLPALRGRVRPRLVLAKGWSSMFWTNGISIRYRHINSLCVIFLFNICLYVSF